MGERWTRARGWLRDNLLIIAAIGLGLALVLMLPQCTERRVERRVTGEVRNAQVAGEAVDRARVTAVETAGQAASLRIGETVDAGIADVRVRAAAARERVRQQANRGAARGEHVPGLPGAAATADGAAGEQLVVVEDREITRLKLRLVDVAEEGDVYREQVMGWQAWYREQYAAWAMGQAVAAQKE